MSELILSAKCHPNTDTHTHTRFALCGNELQLKWIIWAKSQQLILVFFGCQANCSNTDPLRPHLGVCVGGSYPGPQRGYFLSLSVSFSNSVHLTVLFNVFEFLFVSLTSEVILGLSLNADVSLSRFLFFFFSSCHEFAPASFCRRKNG